MTHFKLLTATLCLALLPTFAFGGWSFGSDHQMLKDHVIVAVGELEKESRLDYETGERLEWYAFDESLGGTTCLAFVGFEPLSLSGEAALLLVDRQENLRIAMLETTVGDVEVTLERVRIVGCPSRY